MGNKVEWPARQVSFTFYHPNTGDRMFSLMVKDAINEVYEKESEIGYSVGTTMSDGDSYTAANGVVITVSTERNFVIDGEGQGDDDMPHVDEEIAELTSVRDHYNTVMKNKEKP
jgi:hypothetical protein